MVERGGQNPGECLRVIYAPALHAIRGRNRRMVRAAEVDRKITRVETGFLVLPE